VRHKNKRKNRQNKHKNVKNAGSVGCYALERLGELPGLFVRLDGATAESDALLERGSMTFIQSLYHRHTTTNGRLEGQVHRTDALGLLERWDLVLTAFCGRGLPRDAMSSRRCLELTARCSSAGKAAVGKQPASVARSDRYTKKERNSRAGRVIKERNWAGKDEERKERNLEAEKIAESPNPCVNRHN
jgi:hypothetical protein